MSKPFIEALESAETAGGVMDALLMAKTGVEVAEFMEAYRKRNPYADANVRHMLGYYSEETQRVYYKLLAGKVPGRFDSMNREQLIARIEELEGATQVKAQPKTQPKAVDDDMDDEAAVSCETQRCSCRMCECLNQTLDGGVCGDCASGGHQG